MADKRIFDGFVPHPEGCPRGRTDCQALSRVASPNYESFMCCGETNEDSRLVPQDGFRLCVKSTHKYFANIMVNLDQRDAIDTASVLLGALSSDAQAIANAED